MTQKKKNGRNRIKNTLATTVAVLTIISATLWGISFRDKSASAGDVPEPERVDTGFVLTGPESFDSADTAILVDRDDKENTLTFLNPELGRRYTLSVNGTTRLYDKYGQSLSLEQFRKGDIVDITFLKSEKHLTTMQLSTLAWSYTEVQRYELNMIRGEIMVGSDTYKLTENTQYLSDNRNIEIMDLNPSDVLSFQGINSEILSVRVDKGHGYLRLVNDENFVGGWIEVGQTMIQRITDDMLLTVPEGSYQVNISNKGGGGIKTVVINRNEETSLDIGDLEIPEPQYGTVLFSVSPSTAELYIDGTKTDTSEPVSLEYGLHQLIARANGYHSITQYIRVAQATAGIDIELDAIDGDEKESSSASSETSEAQTTTSYYKVYIDAPENVEVYLDGNYIGISPCNFRKTEGYHVITLRRTGYVTRSYTVVIDSEERDMTLSFADLVATGGSTTTSSSNSSSSNSSSANTSSANTSSANTSSANTSSANTSSGNTSSANTSEEE